ncbi:MAG: acyl-CoA dehydrogenase family protein [Acidimicrobiia bacterium]
MDFGDTPEEAAFRAECREWLEANAPRRRAAHVGGILDLLGLEGTTEEAIREAHEWQARKADAGWAGITWPTRYGGRGGTPMQQVIFGQEESRFATHGHLFAVGIGMGGPTLLVHGTEEQRERWLPPLLRGDEIWCQLFSEPGAGSDLAMISSRAVLDGDHFVLNGQKVWSSGAHYSQWGMFLARTDPEAPKNRGITWMLVDLASPGVTIRPLRQMTGGAHFNEVFFDDVRVPVGNVVGDVNDGWRVATTTLLSERASVGSMLGSDDPTPALVALARAGPAGSVAARDPRVRQQLAACHTDAAILRYIGLRVLTAISKGGLPGPEATVLKLAIARQLTRAAELGLELLGPAGISSDPSWQSSLLMAPALRIGGGTDEILKNVIGEQVLGLPREPSVDRGVPYRELAARAAAPR